MQERLQKVIAQSGVCSRRKAEELILAGKVKEASVTIPFSVPKVTKKHLPSLETTLKIKSVTVREQ